LNGENKYCVLDLVFFLFIYPSFSYTSTGFEKHVKETVKLTIENQSNTNKQTNKQNKKLNKKKTKNKNNVVFDVMEIFTWQLIIYGGILDIYRYNRF
jgi:hypothetical protein